MSTHGSIARCDGRGPDGEDGVDSFACHTRSATTASSTASSPIETSTRKRKREQIPTACGNCRMSKLKCSGSHPTCARCRTRGLRCTYDVAVEGLTRREYLRLQYEEQKKELERATVVMNRLQTGSDREATELLARLRLGESVEELYEVLVGENRMPDGVDGVQADDGAQSGMDTLETDFRDDPAGLRSLSISGAATTTDGASQYEFSTGPSSPESIRRYIQDDTMVFPVYRRPTFPGYEPYFYSFDDADTQPPGAFRPDQT